jgi:hypothetical protein
LHTTKLPTDGEAMKECKDCKWYDGDIYCCHPKYRLFSYFAVEMRKAVVYCGTDAKLFEKKEGK